MSRTTAPLTDSAAASRKPITVYSVGVFDLLHVAHVRFLEDAKRLGDRLIVGVHSDEVVAGYKRKPVIPYEQRVEMVASLKCVDKVIEGPPSRTLKAEWYASHGIDLHVQGDDNASSYLVPKSLGIFRTVASTLHMHTSHIINRFVAPRMRACVVGDGGAAMALAAVLAARVDMDTTLLTCRPESWSKRVKVMYSDDSLYCSGELYAVGSDPAELVAAADVVLLAGPPSTADVELARVAPHLKAGALLGSMSGATGFPPLAHKHLTGMDVDVFATREQPYVARVVKAGSIVRFDGRAVGLAVAAFPADRAAAVAKRASSLLGIPCVPLPSCEEGVLALTTDVLCVIRMYALFRDWDGNSAGWGQAPLMFAEWDAAALDVALACDAEVQALRRASSLDTDTWSLPQLQRRTYSHQIKDTSSPLAMLRSNSALAHLEVPMIRRGGGGDWVPDVRAPHLVDGVKCGLLAIKALALQLGAPTPRLDDVLHWAQRMIACNAPSGSETGAKAALDLPGERAIAAKQC